LVVIKTLNGSANAAAEVIDSLGFQGIMGSIAGDNTIFIATASQSVAEEMTSKFLKLLDK
ncbi:MAG: arginine repressor, partial [Christensenellaceae bacterium]